MAPQPQAELEVGRDRVHAREPTEGRGRMRRVRGESACEERGLALADADAQRREPVTAAPPAQLVEERHDEPRAAHAERVAERDRAAVHVHALRVEPELADHREALRRERLVQLDEIDLADGDARSRRAACAQRAPARCP